MPAVPPPRPERPTTPLAARTAVSRRGVLHLVGLGGLGAAGGLVLAGCGPVRLGEPATYTPPPPGIDDLYRPDLIALMDRAIAGVGQLLDPSSSPEVTAALEALAAALPVQREALLTGAQAERESEAAEDGSPSPAPGAGSGAQTVPADAPSLLTLLVELRDLCVDAARQVSGSLARPVCATGAHLHWAALRLQRALGEAVGPEAVPAPARAEEIVPTREVPAEDPPSIGAEEDYHATIETAQQEEWYTAYVHEVLAAQTDDVAREGHLAAAEMHRTRADTLVAAAEEDGAPVVTRQPVYALPGGRLDARAGMQMPPLLANALLVSHVALVGAAPFERRALSIAAALEEAGVLSGTVGRLEPLPSLLPTD